MSASVWFEEVNTGLKDEILNTVYVIGKSGANVLIDNDAVVIRKPEEDFKIEVFPCVSIYNRTYWHDPLRYDPVAVKVATYPDKKIIEMEETAVPFNLSYQIDFWSKFQTDMDIMTRSWLFKHFRQFNLKVVDDGGYNRTCNCMTKGNIVRSDLTLNGDRLFHSITNIEIWVELDFETRYNMPMVISQDINANQKGE